MTLGKHSKTEEGRIRKERSDSKVGNLAKEYPVLKKFNPLLKLGTLENRLKVDSLDKVLKKAKKI